MTKIESKDQLIEFIRSGEKNPANFKIGTEHEKFVFNLSNNKPVKYDGEKGIKDLLTNLEEFGWKTIKEGNNIIALSRSDALGGGSITLEPAGQFELSGAMLETVHDTIKEIIEHKSQISIVGKKLNLGFLSLGFTPNWKREEIPVMPKERYQVMKRYMPTKGDHGLDMMFRSCTSQVNLDYSSEEDMIKKFRISLLVQPIVTALFANSPFKDGKLNNYKSYRSEVWKDTDPDRTGILPFVFKDNMGYESYVNYALEVPMYFIYRDGNYIDLAGSSFKDFIEGKLDRVSNYSASIEDWELHLTTIFPEVRLKTYLEMRGADAGGVEQICSLSAFWTGLLYDNNSLNKAEKLFNDINVSELAEVRNLVPKEGLNCVVGKYNVYNLASEVIELSFQGLKSRNKLDIEGNDETKYLRPIIEIMKDKENSADKLIRKYNSEWNKDIMKIYEECVF